MISHTCTQPIECKPKTALVAPTPATKKPKDLDGVDLRKYVLNKACFLRKKKMNGEHGVRDVVSAIHKLQRDLCSTFRKLNRPNLKAHRRAVYCAYVRAMASCSDAALLTAYEMMWVANLSLLDTWQRELQLANKQRARLYKMKTQMRGRAGVVEVHPVPRLAWGVLHLSRKHASPLGLYSEFVPRRLPQAHRRLALLHPKHILEKEGNSLHVHELHLTVYKNSSPNRGNISWRVLFQSEPGSALPVELSA